MRDIAQPQADSIEELVKEFEVAQKETLARYDGLISVARKLQHQRNLYEEIIMNSRDAIFVVEEDTGIICHVNEAAEQLMGYSEEDLRGRNQISLFPRELRAALKDEYDKLHQDGGISNLRTRVLRADDSQADVSISVTALPDHYQGLTVAFAREITDQVKAEDDLRTLNETLEKRVEQRTQEIKLSNEELEMAIREANRNAVEAEQANKAKSLFLANMTHEIRTPLNAVVGLLDLLMDMRLGEKEKETALIISRSAKVLGSIINDILDFSKMDAGKLDLEKVVFVLPDLITQLIDTFSFQAREKDICLKLEWDEDLPEFVVGDPGRLRQVLINLLSNAMKFTEEGEVILKIHKVALEGRRHSIGFSVRDTGVGIAPESQQAIFEPFVQADDTITRKFGGTGLGLNIASRLVVKMGGRLEVESAMGQGSTFGFTAHFTKATRKQIEEHKASEKERAAEEVPTAVEASGLNIILAEDNKLNQRVALGMLAKLGHQADVAETGLQVLERLREKPYHLVFMDLQMPEMGGLEAVQKIRAGEAGEDNRHVPVIAMTARASRDDRTNCLSAGMTDYVPKPISTEMISQAMQRVFEPAAEKGEGPAGSGFSLDQLVTRSSGDEDMAVQVLDGFMGEARRKLNLIIGALQNYDFDFAIGEAKNLESGARTVHADNVAQLTRDLVQAALRKQQEYALNLAADIKTELRQMETVI